MERNRPIWHVDAVRAAVRSGDLGAIIRAVRHANHLTLADLAERCGYSMSTLSRLETGRQPLRDVDVLRNLAEALRISPALLGLSDTPARSVRAPRPAARVRSALASDEETDPMRRRTLLAGLTGLAGTAAVGTPVAHGALGTDPIRALERMLLAPSAGGIPIALPSLRPRLAAARSTFSQGRYSDVAARLHQLLPAAHATRHEVTSTGDIASADVLLAELYTLTTKLMIKLGNDSLAWTAADRAMQKAHGTTDVLTQAAASRAWAIVLRRTNHADTAQHLIINTAAVLQPGLHQNPDHLPVYGSLLSTAAYTAAVDGDRDTSHTLVSEATDAARRLHGDHRFGAVDVGLYQISIARVLGDFGAAIDTARRVDPRAITHVERRARYWSDIARAFHQWGKPEQCYQALLAAERTSPDEVRYRKPIQQITTSLLRQPHPPTGIHAFVRRNSAPRPQS